MQIQSLRGTRSLYPKDMRKRNAFVDACRRVLERAGYEEYEAPILEPLSLYEAKSSAEIIERQSYVFTDRGGEKIVVRPELTPSLARMIANKQGELPPLIRWYSFADCWRYERPQKGRSRNFFQLNVDFLGSDSIESDVEAIDLALSVLEATGLDMLKIQLRINDRASFNQVCDRLNIQEAERGRFLTLLDERDKLASEEFTNQIRVINSQITPEDLKIVEDIKPSARLLSIMEEVEKLGWTQLVYDPQLMRGFAYYTGMVFEVFETSGEYRRALFGGGRYDNLLQAVGGKPMSAVGFGVSDVSLFAALETQGRAIPNVAQDKTLIIPFSKNEFDTATSVAKKLRSKDQVVVMPVPPYELKKQLSMANRIEANTVIIIAPEELKQGKMIEKDMLTGQQKLVEIPS
ncbi:MAG: histidine--tRNA ligase [Patescibacteria group bacterium]